MSQPGSLRRLAALLITLTAAIGLVVTLAAFFNPLLAAYWRWQLAGAADNQCEAVLEQLGKLGEAGVPAMVEALGSTRQSVARPAGRLLWREVHNWAREPAQASSAKLAALAGQLARQVSSFDPGVRAVAADLATEILRQPLDGRVIDRSAVLADCDRILRATAADRRLLAADLQGGHSAGAGGSPALAPGERAKSSAGPSEPFPSEAALPDDAFLAEQNPYRGSAGPASSAGTTSPASGGLAAAKSNAKILARGPSPAEASSAADTLLTARPTTGDDADRARRRWTAMDTIDLMRGLQAVEPATAAEARAELIRRGFSEVHLDLARRLFDPDPEVRKQLVRTLPELRSIDAMPWLLRLTRDDEAEVRLAALTLLATTGDPTMLSRVQEIARQDHDPAVQRTIERLAGRQPAGEGPSAVR
jgi:hypothetical protein